VSNTPGNPRNLLELFFSPGNLLEIYKASWVFSGLVCEFARLSLILVTNSCISECISTKYLVVNQDQLSILILVSVS